MILRVVREDEHGELACVVREFEEPFSFSELAEVLAEEMSEQGTPRGVRGISLAAGDGVQGDWLMRSQWWLEPAAEIARLLEVETEGLRERGVLVSRVFVWVPRVIEAETHKLLWLLSGGQLWLPGGAGETPYLHHVRGRFIP